MPPEVNLSITPREGWPAGNYKVEISGAGFEFAANEPARWTLRGEDPVFDDHLSGQIFGTVSQDGTFFFSQNVDSGNLNEDLEGRDEIYVIVSIGGPGTTNTDYRSNTVRGNFGTFLNF